jgi:hypothetical protein
LQKEEISDVDEDLDGDLAGPIDVMTCLGFYFYNLLIVGTI